MTSEKFKRLCRERELKEYAELMLNSNVHNIKFELWYTAQTGDCNTIAQIYFGTVYSAVEKLRTLKYDKVIGDAFLYMDWNKEGDLDGYCDYLMEISDYLTNNSKTIDLLYLYKRVDEIISDIKGGKYDSQRVAGVIRTR